MHIRWLPVRVRPYYIPAPSEPNHFVLFEFDLEHPYSSITTRDILDLMKYIFNMSCMNDAITESKQKNLTILYRQRTLATIGWTMANPAIIMTYLAVSLDLPIFLAGLLISARKTGNLGAAVFTADFAARRIRKKIDLSITEIVVALCYVATILAILSGSVLLVSVALLVIMLCIGVAEEYQNLLTWDFLVDTLHASSRNNLMFWAMLLGGTGAALLTWLAHFMTLQYEPLARHSIIVAIGILNFFASSVAFLMVREHANANAPRQKSTQHGLARSMLKSLIQYGQNMRLLLKEKWFRRFTIVRLTLQFVELSIPFFTILAAITHGASQKGLAALVLSSAAALIVGGPAWRLIAGVSHGAVMVVGPLLAALSGMALIANHFYGLVDVTFMHAAALFLVTIAVQGVSTSRGLYYLELAPESQRTMGVAASKSLVRVASIGLAVVLSALAHMQHVSFAIGFLVAVNVAAAVVIYHLTVKGHATKAAAQV